VEYDERERKKEKEGKEKEKKKEKEERKERNTPGQGGVWLGFFLSLCTSGKKEGKKRRSPIYYYVF